MVTLTLSFSNDAVLLALMSWVASDSLWESSPSYGTRPTIDGIKTLVKLQNEDYTPCMADLLAKSKS